MLKGQWSARRERQYADIKQGLLSRGRGRSHLSQAQLERALRR